MRTTFVYQPRSGSRWLPGAEPRRHVGVPVVEWANGCAHVYGAHIAVESAAPNRHWRTEAREAAGYLAKIFAGVAWDAGGEVNLVVPPQLAATALVCMWASDPHTPHWDLGHGLETDYYDLRALVRAVGPEWGIAIYLSRRGGVDTAGAYTAAVKDVGDGKTCVELSSDDGIAATVVAPWPLRAVYGAEAAEIED